MHLKKYGKKSLSLLLVFAMILSLVCTSMSAFATDDSKENYADQEQEVIVEDSDTQIATIAIDENGEVTIDEIEDSVEVEVSVDGEDETYNLAVDIGDIEVGDSEDEIGPVNYIADADEYGIQLLSGDTYVSAINVSNILTGTSPFDTKDDPGYDSSASNDIVRSFDTVIYSIGVDSALLSGAAGGADDRIEITATLPCPTNVAYFVTDGLGAVEDVVVTDNGDSSTLVGYVSRQSNAGENDVFDLYVGIGNVANGTQIAPSFSAKIEEGDDALNTAKTVTADPVTVSSRENYALDLNVMEYNSDLGTFNLSGDGSKDQNSGSTSIYGLKISYGVTLMGLNDSQDKELKGLYFSGKDISFDIHLSEVNYLAGGGESHNAGNGADNSPNNYTPVLWDYIEAGAALTGKWGRDMTVNVVGTPYNNYNQGHSHDRSCYNGGSWTITQSGTYDYHATVSGWTINPNTDFPTITAGSSVEHNSSDATNILQAHQAAVSACAFATICQWDENRANSEEKDGTVVITVVAGENSSDVDPVTKQTTNGYTIAGAYNSGVEFLQENYSTFSAGGDGLGVTNPGTKLWAWSDFETNLGDVNTFCFTQKWDPDCFEFDTSRDLEFRVCTEYRGNDRYFYNGSTGALTDSYNSEGNSMSPTDVNVTIYWVGMTKSNWDGDGTKDGGQTRVSNMSKSLMSTATDTVIATDSQLRYFTSLEALKSAGYTNCGVMYFIHSDQGFTTTNWRADGYFWVYTPLQVKDSTDVAGGTYVCIPEFWFVGNKDATVGNMIKSASDGKGYVWKTATPVYYNWGDNDDYIKNLCPWYQNGSWSDVPVCWADYGQAGDGFFYGTAHTGGVNGYNGRTAFDWKDAYMGIGSDITEDQTYIKTVMNDDGTLKEGTDVVNNWYGNSLKVVTELGQVSIKLTDDTAGTGNLIITVPDDSTDDGYAYTSYTVTPFITSNGMSSSYTTTATVKVTLPADVEYVEGATFNGNSITPAVSANSEGATVLTFTLNGVSCNTDLGNIQFTVRFKEDVLRDRDSAEFTADAQIWTTNTNDVARQVQIGNEDTATFLVDALDRIMVSESPTWQTIKHNETFTWTLTARNFSSTDQNVMRIADVLPYNGDNIGNGYASSSYHGFYRVHSVTIDFSDADASFKADENNMHVYASSDQSYSALELVQDPSLIDGWNDLDLVINDSIETITITNGVSNMKSFYFDFGDFDEYDTIKITFEIDTYGNHQNDVYWNEYAEEGNSADIVTFADGDESGTGGTSEGIGSEAVGVGVDMPNPDLDIEKTVTPNYTYVGDYVDYTITVTETESCTVCPVVKITDEIPAGLIVDEDSVQIYYDYAVADQIDDGCERDYRVVIDEDGNIYAEVTNMHHNDTVTITLTCEVYDRDLANSVVDNIATVTGELPDDPDDPWDWPEFEPPYDEDTAEFEVGAPDINIVKEVDQEQHYINDTVYYTMTVTQPVMGATTFDVVMTDTFEDCLYDLTVVSAECTNGHAVDAGFDLDNDHYLTAKVDELAYGDEMVVVVSATIGEEAIGQIIPNTAYVTDYYDDEDDDDAPVEVLEPLLSIKKDADATRYYPDDIVTYTITVGNSGIDTIAYNAEITDTIPEGLQLIDVQYESGLEPDGDINGEAITVDTENNSFVVRYSEFAYGETSTVTVTATALEEYVDTMQENTATFDATNAYPVTDTATVEIIQPLLEIEKYADKDMYYVGEDIVYTINLSSVKDGVPAYDVILRDTMPDGVTLNSVEVEGATADVYYLADGEDIPDIPAYETPAGAGNSENRATTGEQNALARAESYLTNQAFSYSGLIEQLEYEGYTTEEATYAADNCGADWYEEAVTKAESYMSNQSFSYSGLMEQLEYEGFTTDQAEYAADVVFGYSAEKHETESTVDWAMSLELELSYAWQLTSAETDLLTLDQIDALNEVIYSIIDVYFSDTVPETDFTDYDLQAAYQTVVDAIDALGVEGLDPVAVGTPVEIETETETEKTSDHIWSVEMTIAEDLQTATATFTCEDCGEVQTVECNLTSAANDIGGTTYTASVVFEGVQYSGSFVFDENGEFVEATGIKTGSTYENVYVEGDLRTHTEEPDDGTHEVTYTPSEEDVSDSFAIYFPYLNPGQTATITIYATADRDGEFVNLATAEAPHTPPVEDDTPIEVILPELAIEKTVNTETANVGDTVAWNIVVTETVPDATALNVYISDSMPAGLTIVGTPTVGGVGGEVEVSGQDIYVTTDSLSYGEELTVAVQTTVGSELEGKSVVNTAYTGADYIDEISDSAEINVPEPVVASQPTGSEPTKTEGAKTGEIIAFSALALLALAAAAGAVVMYRRRHANG